MINNKSQLIKRIKENKESIKIKRLYNFDNNNKIQVGEIGAIEHVQSNAFTIKYPCLKNACWLYLNGSMDVEIKDNKIIYYQFISEGHETEAEQIAMQKNIDLIRIKKDDKINKDYMKTRNFLYVYKFVYIINEIMEV
jgi:hypothetical protein